MVSQRKVGVFFRINCELCLTGSVTFRLLAAGSANSGQVIIWDVFANHPTVLPRVGNGIISLKWSPTGDYLFAASSYVVLFKSEGVNDLLDVAPYLDLLYSQFGKLELGNVRSGLTSIHMYKYVW